MLKEATYQKKFAHHLKHWVPTIIESVKKELKNEHLRQDLAFSKRYFAGKNIQKLTTEELVDVYSRAIEEHENGEALAEFISNRWLLKHGDLYGYFEQALSAINPDFSAIEEIDIERSRAIVSEAVKQFGAPRTYLFSVINSVVFPEQIYQELGEQAKRAAAQEDADMRISADAKTVQSLKDNYERIIESLTDRYEKKLIGLQKKYVQDTEQLKKQLAQLQRKLSGV